MRLGLPRVPSAFFRSLRRSTVEYGRAVRRYRSLLRGGLAAVSVLALSSCSENEPLSVTALPKAPAATGAQIVNGFGACGFCHSTEALPGAPLAGGRLMADKFGDIQAPNITFAKSGIENYRDKDLFRLFRSHTRPDQSYLSPAFHGGFEWISDGDIASIISYLRSKPPVARDIPHREISFVSRNTTGFFDGHQQVQGAVPDVTNKFTLEYGQYIVDHVARCGSCHTTVAGLLGSDDYLAGYHIVSFDGENRIAPNITQSRASGIGGWSEEDFRRFFSTGVRADGRPVDPRFCPVKFYATAPQEDIEAVITYLRNVPPID